MMIRLPLAFLTALLLSIVPLPQLLMDFRPPWLLLLILYLQFYLPKYFNIMVVFALGLLLDSMLSTTLGEHAFALCFAVWLSNNKARRFALFPIGQQMMFVGFIVLAYQLNIVLIDSFLSNQANLFSLIKTGLTTILLWPWLRLSGEAFLLSAD